jgi:hypothetical protein
MGVTVIDRLQRGGLGTAPFAITQEADTANSYLTVADLTARDAIPEWKRLPYMRVHVISDGNDYRLGANVTIAGQVWTEIDIVTPGTYQLLSEKNQPNGYVGLQSNSKINPIYIDNIYANNSYVVDDNAARNALTTLTGDIIIVTDDSKIYVKLNNNPPTNVDADFAELLFPGVVLSVNGMVGAVDITIANLLVDVINQTDLNNFITTSTAVLALDAVVSTHTVQIADLQADVLALQGAIAGPALIPTYNSLNPYTLNQAVKYQEVSGRYNLYVANNAIAAGEIPGVDPDWLRLGDYYTTAETTTLLASKANLVGGVVPISETNPAGLVMTYIAANIAARNAITPQTLNMRVYVTANTTNYIYAPGHPLADPQGFITETNGGVSTSFIALTDTPSSYTGAAGQFVRVNITETGLEFASGSFWSLASGGTLTDANTITGTTTDTLKFVFDNLGVTPVNGAGHWLANTTAATAGNQQISPSLVLEGQGWETTGGTSQSIRYAIDVLPIQTASIGGALYFKVSLNNSAYITLATLNSSGSLTISQGVAAVNVNNIASNGSSLPLTLTYGTNVINTGLVLKAHTSSAIALGETSAVHIHSSNNFAPTSGSAIFSSIKINSVINQTGSANGTIYGLDYNPTLTNVLGTHIAARFTSGQFIIGNTTAIANNRLRVSGIGTTTGLTLLLEDSSGNDRFGFTDAGLMYHYVVPANDNTLTQILVRDGGTGEIKYRTDSSIVADAWSLSVGGEFTGSPTLNGEGNDLTFMDINEWNSTINTLNYWSSPQHQFSGGDVKLDSSAYLNFGGAFGTTGYGFRDNGGVMQFKNNGGSWANFGGGGGSSSGANNEVQTSDGAGGFVASKLFFDETTGNMTLGDSGLAGASRTVSVVGSATNIDFILVPKGAGVLRASNSKLSIGGSNTFLFDISGSDTRISGGGLGLAGNFIIRTNDQTGTNLDSGSLYLHIGTKNGTGKSGNIGLFTTNVANWQSMERGLFIADALTAPTGNPSNGLFKWVDATEKVAKVRDEDGNVYNETPRNSVINIELENGGSDLTTGIKGIPVEIPYDAVVVGWRMMAYNSSNVLTSTSSVVDILMDDFASLPLTGADSIAGTDKPTLSAASTASDSSVTYTQMVKGEYLQAEIESIGSGIARLLVVLQIKKLN